jgi:HSP20 family protein
MFSRFDDPFSAMTALQRALESRLQSDWMGASTAGAGSYPPINIFQQKDDFVAVIELPGIDKNDLQIEAKENSVRVSGRKTPAYGDKASVHRRERLFGVFDRTLSLPVPIDADGIRAEYRDGVLALFIPRAASAKSRSIQIN